VEEDGMSGYDGKQSGTAEALPGLSAGLVLRRMRDMMLLWVLFGGVCGACSEPARGGSLIGVASGVLAGMLVLSLLGACLGLAGGRVLPTLVGGCFGGLFAALLAAVAGASSPLFLASFGLILGGLAGGTLGAMLWWMSFVARAFGLSFRGR
jgi:hypothetical protein